jgi:FkbM family methyltransferase
MFINLQQRLKKTANRLGIEVRKYAPSTSDRARLYTCLSYYSVDLVLDVGANDGGYAKTLRNIGYKGRIVSFEPTSGAYEKLKAKSKEDNLWDIAQRMALGNEETSTCINIASNSRSSSLLKMLDTHVKAEPSSAYFSSEVVEVHRLDQIYHQYAGNENTSTFLKIDVQGFEKQVIDGSLGVLNSIRCIQVELSLIPLYEGSLLFRDMLDFLEDLGYKLYAIIPGFSDKKTGRLLQMDGIFIKNL